MTMWSNQALQRIHSSLRGYRRIGHQSLRCSAWSLAAVVIINLGLESREQFGDCLGELYEYDLASCAGDDYG